MLYCKHCGSTLVMNVTQGIQLLASFGISSNKLAIGGVQLEVAMKAIPAVYYCTGCKKVISDISTQSICCCSHCSDKISPSQAFLIRGSGGIYCAKHAEALSSENSRRTVPLMEVLANVTLS